MAELEGFTLVLPALDEEGTIGAVVEEALRVLPGRFPDLEIVVVDDGSLDGTAAEVEAIARREPRVRCVRHPARRGYGAALRTGIEAARRPVVVLCDGDGQMDPADVPALLAPLEAGAAEAAAGRRVRRADPPLRRWTGRAWSGLARFLLGIGPRDVNAGLKAVRRETALRLGLRSEGGFLPAELLGKLAAEGARISEVPVRHRPRARGSATGVRPPVVLRALRDLLVLGPSVALHRTPGARLPSPRPLALALTALVASLYAAWLPGEIARDRAVDFNAYYVAALGMADGRDVYAWSDADYHAAAAARGIPECAPPYRYPPLTALALRCLLPLGHRAALVTWLVLSAASLLGSAWALGSCLRNRHGHALAVAALAGFVPALSSLHCGQVNPFLLLALSLALLAALRGRPAAAGGWLALAIHWKVVALAHAAWAGATRRWRTFGAALAAAALLGVLTFAAAPPGSLSSIAAHGNRLGGTERLHPTPLNQALSGAAARFLLPADPSGAAARGAWAAGILLLAGATAFLCLRRGGRPGTLSLEFSLVTVAATLIPPYAWFHQYVVLLVPGVVLADRLLGNPGKRLRLGALLGAYAATGAVGPFLRRLEDHPVAATVPCFAAMVLWTLLALELREDGRAPRG